MSKLEKLRADLEEFERLRCEALYWGQFPEFEKFARDSDIGRRCLELLDSVERLGQTIKRVAPKVQPMGSTLKDRASLKEPEEEDDGEA